MKIIEQTYDWKGNLTKRYLTNYIILHHRAGNGDVQSIHRQHVNVNGWTGIGYHFYVRKDGNVYRGRPIDVWGAHCIGYNDKSVSVCFEGNFENETMPAAQLRAGQELITYLKSLYPKAEVKKHRDFDSTACPGKNFPIDTIKEGSVVSKVVLESANDIIWELMNGPLKVPISEVDRAVKTLEKARVEQSSLYWILYKIVNGR